MKFVETWPMIISTMVLEPAILAELFSVDLSLQAPNTNVLKLGIVR